MKDEYSVVSGGTSSAIEVEDQATVQHHGPPPPQLQYHPHQMQGTVFWSSYSQLFITAFFLSCKMSLALNVNLFLVK